MIDRAHPAVHPVTRRQTWDQLAANHPGGHLLQDWDWGELKARFGWQVERLAVVESGRALAGAQILFKPVPPFFSLAYVPKGPLLNWYDSAAATALLEAMHQRCRRRCCVFLKLEPAAVDDEALRARIVEYGFRPSAFPVQPPRTILVDIRPDEEDILADMKQKTRYNIRLAARKGVHVRQGTAADLPLFYHLMEITGQRDQFGIHSQPYYRTCWQLFEPDRAALLLAEVEGETVGGLMVVAHPPTAYYLFGASSDAHRSKMPTYLLQWEAIRWAKRHGCRTYDLWGVPDMDEAEMEAEFSRRGTTGAQLWGVYRFKRGFGGQVVRDAGAFDYVYRPGLYWLYEKMMARRRGGEP